MMENWTEFGVGAFILIAPWVLGFADVPLARWTDVLAGIVLVLVNLWAIYGKGAASPVDAAAGTEGISPISVPQMAAQTVAMKSTIVVKKEGRPKRPRRAKVEKILINS